MDEEIPTIYEWVGGKAVFRAWLDAFYDLVEADELLGPVFGGVVSEEHRAHVTDWWCEVMGGPDTYTRERGGYQHMLAHHRGLAIDREQRLRFVDLLSRAADVAGVPADPECRAALIGLRRVGHAPGRRELRAGRQPVAAAGAANAGPGARHEPGGFPVVCASCSPAHPSRLTGRSTASAGPGRPGRA